MWKEHLDKSLYEHHGVAKHAARPGPDHPQGDLGGEEGGIQDDDVGDRSCQAQHKI